jgi:thiamine-phosphate pyrophosphorylase
MKKTQIYFFLEELNSINIFNLKKLKKISLIYRNYSKVNYIHRAYKIKQFAKQYRHELFISNDLPLATQLSANLYIPAFNKTLKYINQSNKKKIKVIGSAHNYSEIQKKILQGCSSIFVSSIYPTNSHPKKKSLGILKFILFQQYFKSKINIYALGGINCSNINKINYLNPAGIGLKTFLEQKQKQKQLDFLNLIAR